MANSNPSPSTRFRPGQSGNPSGGSASRRQQSTVAKLTQKEVEHIGSLLINGTMSDLEAVANDPNVSVLSAWFANLILASMVRGDTGIFRAVMDRLVGKPAQQVEVSGPGGSSIQAQVELSREERLARIKVLRQQREMCGDD